MQANIVVDLSEFPDSAAGFLGATAKQIIGDVLQTVSSLDVGVTPEISNDGKTVIFNIEAGLEDLDRCAGQFAEVGRKLNKRVVYHAAAHPEQVDDMFLPFLDLRKKEFELPTVGLIYTVAR